MGTKMGKILNYCKKLNNFNMKIMKKKGKSKKV